MQNQTRLTRKTNMYSNIQTIVYILHFFNYNYFKSYQKTLLINLITWKNE